MNKNTIYNIVICRYSEVALKGKNRWRFERCIIDRLNKLLSVLPKITVGKIRGRIIIHNQDSSYFTEEECEIIKENINFVFGLDSFSFCIRTESTIDSIRNTVTDTCKEIIQNKSSIIKHRNPTFRIRVKRSDKSFSMATKDTEINLAELVSSFDSSLRVDLSNNADISIYCEIHKDFALIFYDRFTGQAGLPSGSNFPVLSLLSGGFDSPVASYLIMRRGVFVDFLTFHSYPFTPDETVEKIKKLTKKLNRYQGNRKLFSCNFLEAQKIICAETYETFRTIHYRRTMTRLAEKIAKLNGNLALVTGESVGQVASQTITNLANIDIATEMVILRPLISTDKIDIMKIAEKIDTFNISKIQTPDSCTVFSPSNPSTNAPRKMILAGDSKMDIENLIEIAFKNTTVIDVETNEEIPVTEYFKDKL
jgi:tRNA uracil 4-sulfurtransferase